MSQFSVFFRVKTKIKKQNTFLVFLFFSFKKEKKRTVFKTINYRRVIKQVLSFSNFQKLKNCFQKGNQAGPKWVVKIVFCVNQAKPEPTLIGTWVVRTKHLPRTTEMKGKKNENKTCLFAYHFWNSCVFKP